MGKGTRLREIRKGRRAATSAFNADQSSQPPDKESDLFKDGWLEQWPVEERELEKVTKELTGIRPYGGFTNPFRREW